MFIWPVIKFENPELYKFLQRSTVGTLFALPWYLTWFGHSLNSYKAVVRLYDYFLASPIYTPIFVTAAILLYRSNEILKEDCDMASVHCLLSTVYNGSKKHSYLTTTIFFSYQKICPLKSF